MKSKWRASNTSSTAARSESSDFRPMFSVAPKSSVVDAGNTMSPAGSAKCEARWLKRASKPARRTLGRGVARLEHGQRQRCAGVPRKLRPGFEFGAQNARVSHVVGLDRADRRAAIGDHLADVARKAEGVEIRPERAERGFPTCPQIPRDAPLRHQPGTTPHGGRDPVKLAQRRHAR